MCMCVFGEAGGALKTEFCFGVKCEVTFSTNTPSSTALTHSCSSAGPPPPSPHENAAKSSIANQRMCGERAHCGDSPLPLRGCSLSHRPFG